ncbi:MAG: LuxR C-terminal-related transcriptional regulator [Spirochaetia bacterium]|nr:LuxR C-terminal-related transcriptional regulator [Spirochaetia bacterium]
MDRTHLRLPEVIAALSLATDLANDNPPETTLRICYVALATARSMGLRSTDLADLYYGALLRFIGCTAYAHEESNVLGDDLVARHVLAKTDVTRPSQMLRAVLRGKGKPKVSILWNFLIQSRSMFSNFTSANCEVACMLGAKIGMPEGVLRVLAQVHERWDGRGGPAKIRGDALSSAVRILHVANTVEIVRNAAGIDAACDVIRERTAGQFDPDVCRAFLKIGPDLLHGMETISVWDEVIRQAPRSESSPGSGRLRQIAEAFGSFVDLKSIYTAGRSKAVSHIVENAARRMGLKDVDDLIIASLLADIGMVSVPNNIIEKPGKLNTSEWERVRLHTYYTERILVRSPALATIASIASSHQERLDGSGYHRGSIGNAIPLGARLIAAADTYHALVQRRSYRSAYSPTEAAHILQRDVTAGRIDRTCADAVLDVVGNPNDSRKWQEDVGPASPRRINSPSSSALSPREVEVLRLLARGSSNKEIGLALDISHRTVQHHVEHIYNKITVSTRAAATLYAVENGILTD